MSVVLAVVVLVLGAVAVVAGGADDSPGLQMLGLLTIVGGVVLVARSRRRARSRGNHQ